MTGEAGEQYLKVPVVPDIVVIEKGDEFAPGQRHAMIARRRRTSVGLFHLTDIRVVAAHGLFGVVSGPIVDNEDLEILKRLRADAVQSLVERSGAALL